MNKILTFLFAALISLSAVADQHKSVESEVRAAVEAFNGAYARNEVENYFSYYTDDAMVYFFGARQDVSAYHDEWTETIGAGNAVEKNALSDIQVRVLPGGNAAVASYFIDFRMRSPDDDVSDARAFESEVWQKIDGKWKVVALHYTEIPAE